MAENIEITESQEGDLYPDSGHNKPALIAGLCCYTIKFHKGWIQTRVKIFYLFNVKIDLLTPSLPSIFTDKCSPMDAYDGRKY